MRRIGAQQRQHLGIEGEVLDHHPGTELVALGDETLDLGTALRAQGLRDFKAERLGGDAMGIQRRGDLLHEALVLERRDRQVDGEAGGLRVPRRAMRGQPSIQQTKERDFMPSAELTVQLPAEEIEFLNSYAREHGTTVAEIVARYVKRLKSSESKPLHPDIVNITGLVPPHLDAEAEHRQHLLDKPR